MRNCSFQLSHRIRTLSFCVHCSHVKILKSRDIKSSWVFCGYLYVHVYICTTYNTCMLYMYVVHTYVYIYTHVHTRKHIYTYIVSINIGKYTYNNYKHICLFAFVCVCMYLYVCVYVYIHVYMYMRVWVYACIYVCVKEILNQPKFNIF